MNISPLLGLLILEMVFNNVDFPQPFAPIIMLILPSGIDKFMSSIILFFAYETDKFFTLIASIIISPSSLNK